jgi:hypothetical protein
MNERNWSIEPNKGEKEGKSDWIFPLFSRLGTICCVPFVRAAHKRDGDFLRRSQKVTVPKPPQKIKAWGQ